MAEFKPVTETISDLMRVLDVGEVVQLVHDGHTDQTVVYSAKGPGDRRGYRVMRITSGGICGALHVAYWVGGPREVRAWLGTDLQGGWYELGGESD